MLRLIKINENNWIDAARLSVREDQQRFLDSPIGIIARGYAYASSNAKVIGIADDDRIVGLALVKDMDEEPACYDLQQFMIDRRFQNKGYGTQALEQILLQLRKEGKYDCAEVCVNKDDAPALRLYEKTGFKDTGYVDDDIPDSLNLMYYFPQSKNNLLKDDLIMDFTDPAFKNAFMQYFKELNIKVSDWNALFKEMNDEGCNAAYVRSTSDGETVGFIQFKPDKFSSSFFEETYGFIREFWVAEKYRNTGHGSALLNLAEKYFRGTGIYSVILTTDTAEPFYLKHGYVKTPGCSAKNKDDVFVKRLTQP